MDATVRGRPKKPDAFRETIMLRMREAEKLFVAEAAGETPLATWVREVAIKAAERKLGRKLQ